MIKKIILKYNYFVLIFLALLLAGCTLPKAQVNPEGRLNIFSPAFPSKNPLLNSEWLIDTSASTNFSHEFTQTIVKGKSLALNLLNHKNSYILVKRVDANLLATPFFSWNWKIPVFENLDHPVCILIGFYGGQSDTKLWTNKSIAYGNAGYPAYDRVLKIIWHRNALLRGTSQFNGQIPEYIARGGLENVDKWYSENINLESIYSKIWPKDSIVNTNIVFLGFWVKSSKSYQNKETIASFNNIILSK
ncbi:MAG: DUF3047 domain-containing protein [Rhodospirillaceae bacterium]|nr:DUF3047 domain-containing protein [Rhodospirillaceae bacterium]